MDQDHELQQAISAIQAGDKKQGERILQDVLKADCNNDSAWLWMAACEDYTDDKKYCLQNALRINPNNLDARNALVKLESELILVPEQTIEEKEIQTSAESDINPAADSSPPGSDPIVTVIIVLLAILGLGGLALAIIQVAIGVADANEEGTILLIGVWNLFCSIIILAFTRDVKKRYKHVVNNLLFLGIVGTLMGGYQLLNGRILQVCVIPICIALAVLVQTNKNKFTELTEKEKQSKKK